MENKTCCARVNAIEGWRGHVCGVTANSEREGEWYCGTHDPVARADKNKYKNDAMREKWRVEAGDYETNQAAAAEQARRAGCFDELVAALKDAYPYVDSNHLRQRIGAVIIKASGEKGRLLNEAVAKATGADVPKKVAA